MSIKKEEIIDKIKAISLKTEEIYQNLAEEITLFGGSTHESIQKAKVYIDHIFDDDSNSVVSNVLNNTKKEIEEAQIFFLQSQKNVDKLFEELNIELNKLNALDKNIEVMRESSVDMEIISINTLTVAARAGKAGGAFSYITTEIKKLTQNMIQQADLLSRQGANIQKALRDHQNLLEKITDFQKQIFEKLDTNLTSSFSDISNEIKRILKDFKSLIQEAETVNIPVQRLISVIQFQDIIRQSLDQIILVINSTEPSENFEPIQEQLDKSLLLKQLGKICIEIFNDVSMRLKENNGSFSQETQHIQNIIEEIDLKRNTFIDNNFNSINFSQKNQIFDTLIMDIQQSITMKEEFVLKSKEHIQIVQNLKTMFDNIANIISRFQNISIASKIEVAKQQALADMEGNIKEMTDLIEYIEQNLEKGNSIIIDFTDSIEELLSINGKNFNKEARYVKFFEASLKDKYKKIGQENGDILEKLENFQVFSHSFLELFTKINLEQRKFQDLYKNLEDNKKLMLEFLKDNNTKHKQLLDKEGLNVWTIQNKEYSKLINKFVIFSHKEAAQAVLGGNNAEKVDVLDNGDIVLF